MTRPVETANPFGFRRRCAWCAVELSWWQINLCRLCGRAVRGDAPSPPCGRLSRPDALADRLFS